MPIIKDRYGRSQTGLRKGKQMRALTIAVFICVLCSTGHAAKFVTTKDFMAQTDKSIELLKTENSEIKNLIAELKSEIAELKREIVSLKNKSSKATDIDAQVTRQQGQKRDSNKKSGFTEEEERILRAKKLEKERKKNARIQGPTTTNRPRNGSVPRNVMSGIEKMATADWPGDYQMQKFTIDMQVEAYNSLRN